MLIRCTVLWSHSLKTRMNWWLKMLHISTSCLIVGLGNKVMTNLFFLWSSCGYTSQHRNVREFLTRNCWFLIFQYMRQYRYCTIWAFAIEWQDRSDIVWQSSSSDSKRNKTRWSAFDHATVIRSINPYSSFWVYICQNWHISLHWWAYIRLINLKRHVLHLAGTKNSSWTDCCRKVIVSR